MSVLGINFCISASVVMIDFFYSVGDEIYIFLERNRKIRASVFRAPF